MTCTLTLWALIPILKKLCLLSDADREIVLSYWRKEQYTKGFEYLLDNTVQQ